MSIQIEVLVQVVADFLHKPTQDGKKRKNIRWKEVAADYMKRTGINESNNGGFRTQLKKAYNARVPTVSVGETAESAIRVPDDCTLNEAVNRVNESNGRLTTIVVGEGTHVIDDSNGGRLNYLTLNCPMTIVGVAPADIKNIVVLGGITIPSNIQGNIHIEHLTIRQSTGSGVRGSSSFTLKDVVIEQCSSSGVIAFGSTTVARCTNVTVRRCRREGVQVCDGQGTLTDCTVAECGWSGIESSNNGVIHIEGESTKVTRNCTDYEEREENEYGLCARSRAVIILHSPLTKGIICWHNGDGDITSPDEDWGGEGTIVEEVYDELFKACQQNNPDIVARYVGRIDVNHKYKDDHGVYHTLLKAAAESGNLQIVNILLGVDGIDVNLHDPIVSAAAKGHANVVRKLLTVEGIGFSGVFLDWRGRRDPLWAAIKNDKTEVALMLIEYYVDHGLPTDFSYHGKTPLWNACKSGNVKIVRVLLELFAHYKYSGQGRYPVNHQDSHHIYQTPLSIACENGHLQVVLELLKNTNIKVNLATNDGRTPLLIACQEGHLEIVRALLKDSRVDVHQTDKNRATPLSVACEHGHKDIVKMLLTERPKWKLVYLPRNFESLPAQKQQQLATDTLYEFLAAPGLQGKLNRLYVHNEIKKLIWKREDNFWQDREGNNMSERVKRTPGQFIKITWPEIVDDGVTYYCEDFELKTVKNVFTLTTFQKCTFPDNTFTLNAHDSFSFMDGIDCPVRCLPCKHPFEASALQTWFQQPKQQDNPNGARHITCPECRTVPKSMELMSKIQVERWNSMAEIEKNAESDLQSLRTNTSMYELQEQMTADTRKEASQKTSLVELNKKIQALRTQKDVLHKAAEETRKRLGKNQNNAQYNTYAKKTAVVKKAVSDNNLKSRFKSNVPLKI
jgi:hypothetical protein